MKDRIAITGVHSFLGARWLRLLAEQHGPEQVLALDIAPLPAGLGVRYREVDLTEPESDQRLLDVFRAESVTRVVHAAFLTDPQRDTSQAHELESIGTLNVFAAAAAAGVRQILMRSFTAVYGARGDNPNFLTESRALRPNGTLAWARDKLQAEQHAASFAQRYPDMAVCVLRTAPLLGPGVRTFYTRILDNRVVPVLMGYDPLVQFLHSDDALRAFELALEKAYRGPLNIVPSAPMALRTALMLGGKIPVPVPHPVAYVASDALWASGLGMAPGAFVDYVRYLFVADGKLAVKGLGFTARFNSKYALRAYLRYRYPETTAYAREAHA